MNIVIVGHFRFPTGSASASRVRHLARGLTANGQTVWVVSLVPEAADATSSPSMTWRAIDDVSYFPAGGCVTGATAGSRIVRRIATARRMREAVSHARRAIDALHDRVGLSVAIGYTGWYLFGAALLRHCQRRGIKMVRDVNEWPLAERLPGGRANPLYWNQRMNFTRSLPRADGVIAISRVLADHFGALGLPVIRVPALIDTATAKRGPLEDKAHGASPFRVTYLGACRERDGLDIMLEAMRRLRDNDRDVCLEIIGDDPRFREVREKRHAVAHDPLLRESVVFHGWVSDEEVRHHLFRADALLLNRNAGLSGDAALPTRLPEYLMAGNPVIASDVGDVREYLADGESAILVAPDSPAALADGIERLLALPDQGRAIGGLGTQRCIEYFDAVRHGKRIVEFLNELVDVPHAKTHAEN